MYCEEPIINVCYLENKKTWKNDWEFTDCFFGMDYYVSGNAGFVFQTEHYYITVGVSGLKTYRSKDEFITPDVNMYNYDDWYDNNDEDDEKDEYEEDYEKEDRVLTEDALYFVGEHIRNVTEKPDGWLVEFDHFSLGVHPRTEEEMPWTLQYTFLPYRNLDHKLKRCECGGKARLMVDSHEDYYICCDTCFRSTWGDYRLGIVVKHWNADQRPAENDHTPYESFFMDKDQPIRCLWLNDREKQLGPDHYTCDTLLLQIGNKYYDLDHLYAPERRCMLHMAGTFSSINEVLRPIRIEPESGEESFRFVSLNKGTENETMTLTTGKRNVIITAMPDHLDIRIISSDRANDQRKEKEP